MTDDQIVSLEARIREESLKTVEHVTPEYVGVKASICSLPEVEDAIAARLKLRSSHKLTQYKAKVVIPIHSPVLVTFFGDLHYGSGDADHDLIKEHFKLVRDTPGAYAVLMSNLIDNAIPAQFPDGMLQNVIPPEEQVIAMRQHVQELDGLGKILAAITSPCHEGWTFKKAGQDINRLLFGYDGRKFPILENGGKLLVNLDGVEYNLALYHQIGPFNSNLNKNNGTQRMRQLQHRNADVVAAAHHHVGEVMQNFTDRSEDRNIVCYLRTGCYKLDDQWASGKGYIKGEPGGQSVLLYNRRKKMQPFLELETAIETLQAISVYQRVIIPEAAVSKAFGEKHDR